MIGGQLRATVQRQPPMRALALVLVLVLSACGSEADPTASADPPAPGEVQGTWRLVDGMVEGAALPVVEDWPITLTIDGAELSGTGGCNGYGARLVGRSGTIGVDDDGVVSSGMACEPGAVMDAEAAYLAALGALWSIGVDGDQLVVNGPDIELRFVPVPPAPVADMLGTEWLLETLIVGDVAERAGEGATLRLAEDGSMEGSTGCRSFVGSWVEGDGRILVTRMEMDEAECPADREAQDRFVVSLVGDGFSASVQGELLTLVDPGSFAGVYRAAR